VIVIVASRIVENARTKKLKVSITFQTTLAKNCRDFIGVSSSNKLVASLSPDPEHNLCFLESTTGTVVKQLSGPNVGIGVFGRTSHFACVGLSGIAVWNVETWQLITQAVDALQVATFADKDRWVCWGTRTGELGFLELATLKTTTIPHAHKGAIICLASQTRGDHVAAGGEDTVTIWNLSTKTKSRSFSYPSPVAHLCFSQSDYFLAIATDDGRIEIIDTSTWKRLCKFQAHSFVTGMSFIGNHRCLLTAGTDAELEGGSSIRIFDCFRGTPVYYQRFDWRDNPISVAVNEGGDTLYILFLRGSLDKWRIAIADP
jgi:WD40 repeat protein